MSDFSRRQRKGKTEAPTDISVLLTDLLGKSMQSVQYDAYTLTQRWHEVVGERMTKHLQVLDLQGTTLVLHASSAPWQAEANLQKKAIIVGCNALLGHERVRDIRFG